ncbi:hypothetical protein Tco_0055299, partial [Tanacetum coccineum]
MTEPEPVKKSKKLEEQERLSYEVAMRLQEQEDNERSNYKIKDFKGMSYDDIRPIFERVWKFNQDFVAKPSEEAQEQVAAEEKDEDKPAEVENEVLKKFVEKIKKSLARKRSTEVKERESSKRQKIDTKEATDYEKEKEVLR